MGRRRLGVHCALGPGLLWLALGGCASSPPSSPAGPAATPTPPAEVVVDSSTVELGESTLYRYRFRQIEPASDRFTFQDRDLSFYFRPAPDALHFQIENRQDHPVWIEWERCQFWDVDGLVHRVAHRDTRWENRLSTMPPVPIAGLERYSDYVVPIELLLDPGPSAEQVRRPLFPDDSSAPQYIDRSFGVDLAFRIEDKLRGYTFRFKVASVVPP